MRERNYHRIARTGRRTVLKGGVGFGIALGMGSRVAWGQDDKASMRPQEGDVLVKLDDPSTTPLTPDHIPRGAAPTLAWSMDPIDRVVRNGSRLNRVILVRLDEERLSPETRPRAAGGVVAYTAVCTHTGCEVVDWLADEQCLSCPCHFSKFDPRDGAKVLDGPAPRPLPALPLKVTEVNLVVAKPFLTRVGFEPA